MGLAGAKRIVSEGGTVIVTGLNQGRIADVQAVLGDEDRSSRAALQIHLLPRGEDMGASMGDVFNLAAPIGPKREFV